MSELNTSYIAGLVLRAKANDSDAFAELYALTYNKVYNYARHYMKDDHLAQDALQETYILALKNLNKLNDPSLFIAWLNRITFTVCYDMNSKNKQNSNQLMENEEFENIADTSIQDNPEALYQKKEISHSLKEALEELPFYEKEVIIMRFYNDMKLNEIAASINISLSSVKRYLASAQKKLKKILKNKGDETHVIS